LAFIFEVLVNDFGICTALDELFRTREHFIHFFLNGYESDLSNHCLLDLMILLPYFISRRIDGHTWQIGNSMRFEKRKAQTRHMSA
jgi:hypothetical protein